MKHYHKLIDGEKTKIVCLDETTANKINERSWEKIEQNKKAKKNFNKHIVTLTPLTSKEMEEHFGIVEEKPKAKNKAEK